jgi:hypothetical protein
MHSSVSKARNVDTLFFMLGWHRYGFYKNHAGTHYAKLVVLHLVGYVCHVGHYNASGVRKVGTLFFMLRWDWYRFDNKRFRTCYAKHVFLHPVRYVGHVVHSDASRSRNNDALFSILGWDQYGICGSHAFRCIRGAKCQHTIFHTQVGLVWI